MKPRYRFVAQMLLVLMVVGLTAPAWAAEEEEKESAGDKDVTAIVETYMGVLKDAYEGTYHEMDYDYLQDVFIGRQIDGYHHYIASQQSAYEIESSAFNYKIIECQVFENQAKIIVELDIAQKMNHEDASFDFSFHDQIGLELVNSQDQWVIFRVLTDGTRDNHVFQSFKENLKAADAWWDYTIQDRKNQVVADYQGMDYQAGIKPDTDPTEGKTDAEKAAYEKLLARGFTYDTLAKYSHNWVAIETIFASGKTGAIPTISNGLLSIDGFEIAAPRAPELGTVVDVSWNKEPVIWPDQGPVIVNDRVMVPIRRISEFADGTTLTMVSENPITFAFTADDKPGFLARFIMGQSEYELRLEEGAELKKMALYEPLYVVEDRTMVPLRTIGEVFGAQVEWHANQYLVTIENTD